MYYVYEFFKIDTGEIFYVGKGKGNRYKCLRKRNNLFNEIINKYDYDSRIVKYFENEKEAYSYEYDYIQQLKAQGQCSCNIHPGGAGGSGEYWTENLKHSMSEKCPFKNPEVIKKNIERNRKEVLINGTSYFSIKDASEQLGVSIPTIREWCKKGINKNLESCRFVNEEPQEHRSKQYNRNCRPLIYKGTMYESPKDLAEELHCSKSRICTWARKGFDINGEPCRYLDDNRKLSFENKRAKPNCPIIVNGVKYESCKDASEKLNISIRTIYNCLKGNTNNLRCEYIKDIA